MSNQEKGSQAKFSYRYRFEADAPPKVDQEEIDRRALQEYINRLLGVSPPPKADTTNSTT
jgi:hypothetical protein